MSDNTSTILTETGVGSDPTVRDLLSRVAALEDAMQTHTGDSQGASGQFYPHPVQIIDTAEFGGGSARNDSSGVQLISGSGAGLKHGLLRIVKTFFAPGSQGYPPTGTPGVSLEGFTNAVDDIDFVTGAANDLSAGVDSGLRAGYFQALIDSNKAWTRMVAQDGDGASGGLSLDLFNNHSTGDKEYSFSTAAPLTLTGMTSDPSYAPANGAFWYRTDLGRYRFKTAGIVGNLALELQSNSATAIATSGTITTAGVSCARVNPAGAVTGIILQSGTTGGQMCIVVNEAAAANTVTFAASGTSHVADGASSVIAGLNARLFIWDSGTSLWYPCK